MIKKPHCLFYETKKTINLKFYINEFFKYTCLYLMTMGNQYFYIKKQPKISIKFYRKAAFFANEFEEQGLQKYLNVYVKCMLNITPPSKKFDSF